MDRRHLLPVGISLLVNVLVSWTLLPLVMPPFRMYTLPELAVALLWQGMGSIAWPLVFIGILLSVFSGGDAPDLGSVLIILVYPGILVLAIRVFTARALRVWALVLLHILLVLSFAAVWSRVLNGYEFMVG